MSNNIHDMRQEYERQLAAKEARIAALEAALGFYAEYDNHIRYQVHEELTDIPDDCGSSEISLDSGEVARQALTTA